ncbi:MULTISPECIES: exopolysaccharide biosynthesis polyprenyl glycosylphosphotransferase [Pseudidiomarina]|uniref:Exopolysaccharide biosynthesis polyprenyl glycosylphosphotransferase n=2 Tax=Pseudidiomarina TaxID=2800384 RepID=A0A317PXV9_9GAMM|nr:MULTISPECIES: exopolysaccharide biosynthesis polyprenyl glycosylphosphotransferase [Pseudidiomarina]PWW05921.1 exopolysaccharide biosynthesis polyprenyl glycosylphosphotransferase [Pseudidiomarina maritima]RBP89894.1 exopolysaccharide biosynthesis polyprenyl glycosylphosphotransferase [Pseudidiomarina tainanensis]
MLRASRNSLIHVYCPDQYEKKVSDILKARNINFVINEFDLKSGLPAIVCHYRSYAMDEDKKAFLIDATERGAWVEPLVSYLDKQLGFTEIDLVDSSYFLHQKAFSILSNWRPKAIKRFFDIVLSVLGLIILSPLLLITGLLIKLDSKGPIFYRQARVGLFNKEFDVVKFRSMTTDAEANGAQWACKNDVRVTRVGKFIRKTRIDELPQLINVVKGEMSLIGPRPEREVFIEDLEKSIPYYRFRHAVKPGITGLAQVKYPYGASIEDAQWKHRYDLHYIKHQTALMDFKIVVLTIYTVLFAKGQ